MTRRTFEPPATGATFRKRTGVEAVTLQSEHHEYGEDMNLLIKLLRAVADVLDDHVNGRPDTIPWQPEYPDIPVHYPPIFHPYSTGDFHPYDPGNTWISPHSADTSTLTG